MANMWLSWLNRALIRKYLRHVWRSLKTRLMGFSKIALLCAALALTGCGVSPPAAPPLGLAVAFAHQARAYHETLQVGHYSAQGHEIGRKVNLGALGLVAQTQIMASVGRTLWVTTGYSVWRIRYGGLRDKVWTAPRGQTILSVAWAAGHLWAVTEPVMHSRHVRIYEDTGTWVLRALTPLAITTIEGGPHGSVAVLSAMPESAVLSLLSASESQPVRSWKVAHQPQGTVAFTGHTAYVPVSIGLRGFAVSEIDTAGRGSQHLVRYSSVWRAVTAVISGRRPYGIAVKGLVPLKSGPLNWNALQDWPHPMQATITEAGGGAGLWVLILDGPSQGYWFNTAADHFGRAFSVTAPAGSFSRAVVPWN